MSDSQRTMLAIVLMAVILLVFFSEPYQRMMSPDQPVEPVAPALEGSFATPSDTIPAPVRKAVPAARIRPDSLVQARDLPETLVRVTTPKFELVFSSLGGGTLKQVFLNDYFLKDSSRVQLIPEDAAGILANQFIGYEVENFSTADLPATCSLGSGPEMKLRVFRSSKTLSYTIPLGPDTYIERTFTFYADSFHFDLDQKLVNLGEVNAGRYFATSWQGGITTTEPNLKDDLFYTKMYALLGDERSPENFDAKDEEKHEVTTGLTRWVGLRSKYFTVLMVPDAPISEFRQSRQHVGGDQGHKIFDFDLRDAFDRRDSHLNSDYTVYIGPLDYDVLKGYNLHFEEMMNWGWFGIIGKWSLRLFKWMYTYIPNYGIVLLIFSVLVKLLTSPLTKKQLASTQRMQQLQPAVAELKEKYKGDPQKLQQEQMKLYKEMGVNPMGGCWPLLVQMPILIAMFNLFRTTIELRGAAFGGLEWWIPDLSLPDTVAVVAGLPINPLPILMAVTMIFQQKMMSPSSAATNPQMKNMPYIMTVVFLFIFYRFPSGLNLYYTLFNVMSILQQKLAPVTPVQAKGSQVQAKPKASAGKSKPRRK